MHEKVTVNQTPVALLALAQHIVDHKLPPPTSIDTPLVTPQRDLIVHVRGWDLDAWLASLPEPDDEAVEHLPRHRMARRRVWTRLPDLGIRLQITGVVPACEAVAQ